MIPTWSDDRVELLKKLWTEGFSASQIAAEIGNVSRNAVIGKIHRLGLCRDKDPRKSAPRRQVRAAKPQMTRVVSAARRSNVVPVSPFERAEEVDPAVDHFVPPEQRVSMMELNDATCRWPVGDPQAEDFYFCGGQPRAGAPYCAHHARIGTTSAYDRRRTRPKL